MLITAKAKDKSVMKNMKLLLEEEKIKHPLTVLNLKIKWFQN